MARFDPPVQRVISLQWQLLLFKPSVEIRPFKFILTSHQMYQPVRDDFIESDNILQKANLPFPVSKEKKKSKYVLNSVHKFPDFILKKSQKHKLLETKIILQWCI